MPFPAEAIDARVSIDRISVALAFVFPNGTAIAETHGAPLRPLRSCHQDKQRFLSKERAIGGA
jgi:hypothetical protein